MTAVLYGLIQICLIVLVAYVVIYVLTSVLELPIPAKVIQIIWVIVALFAVIYLVTKVLPSMGIRVGYEQTTQIV